MENTCRWLTVMASGREIHLDDLPPELVTLPVEKNTVISDWETLLRASVDQQLLAQESEIAKHIIPSVEAILIQAALNHTRGNVMKQPYY